MTRFATEQVSARLLREGKVVYKVTLDLIVQESGVDELPTSITRNIVRMDLVHGTVVENGYYGLQFNFDGRQMEDTVYVKGTALMHRVSSLLFVRVRLIWSDRGEEKRACLDRNASFHGMGLQSLLLEISTSKRNNQQSTIIGNTQRLPTSQMCTYFQT